MFNFTGLAHVAIKVFDLDRTLAFYRDTLGFAEMFRLHKDDGSVWIVYLRITDSQYLEIFTGAETDRAPGWDANGANHICLTVADLHETVAELHRRGIPLLIEPKQVLDGNWQAWIEDPDGNRLEMVQIDPDCLQLQAIARLRAEGKG